MKTSDLDELFDRGIYKNNSGDFLRYRIYLSQEVTDKLYENDFSGSDDLLSGMGESGEKFSGDDGDIQDGNFVSNSQKGDSEDGKIFAEAEEKKYPLVIFFHGAGERGDDNKRQLSFVLRNIINFTRYKKEGLIMLAPQCPYEQKWADLDWSETGHEASAEPTRVMSMCMDLLKETMSKYPVDESRIYVTGLSMGGYGTWDIIARMPETFAAALAVCGGGDVRNCAKISSLPIWAFHGSADRVVPVENSRRLVEALRALGSPIKYTEYQEGDHDAWSQTYANEEVLTWFFSQRSQNLPSSPSTEYSDGEYDK